MAENISQEFWLKNMDETRKYLFEEINWKELVSKKHKKVCTTLNYIKHFLIWASTITGCVSTSAFTSAVVSIPIGITSSNIGLKMCAKNEQIKNYKSTITQKEKKYDKTVLAAKSKLNRSLNF